MDCEKPCELRGTATLSDTRRLPISIASATNLTSDPVSHRISRFPAALGVTVIIATVTGVIQVGLSFLVAAGAESHGFDWLMWPLLIVGWGFALARLGIAIGLVRRKSVARRVGFSVWVSDILITILIAIVALSAGFANPGPFVTVLWYAWFGLSLGPLCLLSIVAMLCISLPSARRALISNT